MPVLLFGGTVDKDHRIQGLKEQGSQWGCIGQVGKVITYREENSGSNSGIGVFFFLLKVSFVSL